jgi:flagellar biosynthesis/type III secretory pathway protein FliH
MCNLSKGVYDKGIQDGIQQGVQQGLQQGLQQGEDLLAQLMTKLFSLGRTNDAERAAADKEYRKMLMEEFQITKS